MNQVNDVNAKQFLSDLAAATRCSVESLVDAGYDQSVPEYIANGKTVKQVANVILSSRRRAQKH